MGYHEISRHWLKPSCFQHMFHTCHLKEATDTSAGNKFFQRTNFYKILQGSQVQQKTTRKNHTSLFLANGADWAACLLSTSRITSGTSRTRRYHRLRSRSRRVEGGRRSEGSLFHKHLELDPVLDFRFRY